MDHDFEALGKEIVVGRLKDAADPYALAGEVIRKMIVAAVVSEKDRRDPRSTIVSACRGVAGGMVLLEKDLVRTSIAVLERMASIAEEAGLSPSDCMTWALEGLAPVLKVAPGGAADAVRAAVEEKFMGAGEVLERLLSAPPAP